jgi:hypothetical protein
MRKIVAFLTSLLCGAVLLTAVSPPASAATFTVTPTGPYTGASAGTVVFRNTRTGQTVACTSSAMSGNVPSSTVTDAQDAASINAMNWSGCTFAGMSTTVTAALPPWFIRLISALVGGARAGVRLFKALIQLTGCQATLEISAGATLEVTYSNLSGRLTFTGSGTLTAQGVIGCFGLILVGDQFTLTGTFSITPKWTITSP